MSFIGMGMNVYEMLATCTEMNEEHKQQKEKWLIVSCNKQKNEWLA